MTIKNEAQYRITKTWKERFEENLRELVRNPPNIDQILLKAHIDGTKSMIDEFRADLLDYEKQEMEKAIAREEAK